MRYMLPDGLNFWLLLVVSLPTEGATARMRIWRALKAQGCMALRDGAYLLPGGEQRERALRELADECIREGGSAWLMAVRQSPTPSYLLARIRAWMSAPLSTSS